MFDSIIVGEADRVWKKVINDFASDQLRRIYMGGPCNMKDLPVPRYDLLSNRFFIKKVIQATRGCYYNCSFCSVPSVNPGYRMRPVEDIIAEASYDNFPYWWQRKIVWFWDDNLLINRKYATELLERIKPLKKWWLTQASIDIAKDEKLLELMKKSGCIGVFIGIESFTTHSLTEAKKNQNKLINFRDAVKKIHSKGICVMAGLIAGFDTNTRKNIIDMASQLKKIRIDVPFISILTPFKGTPVYKKLQKENRLIPDRTWDYYNGYNVAFIPLRLSSRELLEAHRILWKKAFSPSQSLIRIFRGLITLRSGAFLMSFFMNSFYGYKRLMKNTPVDMSLNMNSHKNNTNNQCFNNLKIV